MKTYKVLASSITYFTLEIEAENERQAWLNAKEADGSEFRHDGDGDWCIVEVEELKEVAA
jgi:hypothetical protein